jgi:hypothetical protein
MEISLANQVAYLKQTNARKNLYQGNALQQHTNVEMPHPVGIECSITVLTVKYHKISRISIYTFMITVFSTKHKGLSMT